MFLLLSRLTIAGSSTTGYGKDVSLCMSIAYLFVAYAMAAVVPPKLNFFFATLAGEP